MPELSFFIGKGGVGKTTVSSAYAVYRAHKNPRRRVLLLSTDPAHSLADLFQIKLGDTAKRLPAASGTLHLWQINAEKRFQQFLAKYRNSIFTLLESGTIFAAKEIEPLLSTTLPGMAEVAALLAISDLIDAATYDEIVVDTAPIGHTLRLFQMPEHFLRFLDFLDVAGSRDQLLAAHFGGRATVKYAFLKEWGEMVARTREALSEGGARLVLVTTPETFALNESVRATKSLQDSGSGHPMRITEMVLNRAVVRPESRNCRTCKTRAAAVRSAKQFLSREFPRVPLHIGEDKGSPVMGARNLLAFGEHVFAGKALRLAAEPAGVQKEARLKPAPWPQLPTPLSLTLGKGGVGKTTVSAGLAFYARRSKPRIEVTICSTDPAPSLDDVFEQEIGSVPVQVLEDAGLLAIEIDSVAEFRRWADTMRDKIHRAFKSERRGIHVDLSFERRLFSALLDIVPPGVDELFAVFKILDLLESDSRARVIIDMAPTGHALELLRLPERMLLWSRLLLRALAAHRDLPLAQEAGVEIASISQRVRSLATMLKNRKKSRLLPVMLAEPLPDRQTERLLKTIQQLGAHIGPIFVNRVLFAEAAQHCPRCQRARRWQLSTLKRLAGSQRRFLVVPEFGREIAGAGALQSFTRHLWQPS